MMLDDSAWRHRLPNDSDPISVWEDVFLWRSHMFNTITTNFSWSEPGTLATLHDRPWTSIRLASTARKQGIKEVGVAIVHFPIFVYLTTS